MKNLSNAAVITFIIVTGILLMIVVTTAQENSVVRQCIDSGKQAVLDGSRLKECK